jgi:hypothetical protein
MKNVMLKFTFYCIIIFYAIALISCSDDKTDDSKSTGDGEAAYSASKDANIQRYNLEKARSQSGKRTPCDTLSIVEYIINNYPSGSYLVDFDQTNTYNAPKHAVFYYNQGGSRYVFAIVVKSGKDNRLIEKKNVIGYDQSYIDLDSTELGTPLFSLVLFKCDNNYLQELWDTPIPNHGGFNRFSMEKWKYNGTSYICCNFYDARSGGYLDYNYFFVDGIESKPHLLMTYEGINFKRTVANVNNDKYPDYLEYVYFDNGDKVYTKDAVPFIWDVKTNMYVNTRNRKQTRPY